jgi:uncharacterized protein
LDQHVVVTLARLRDAAELYRQLADARRHQARGQERTAELAALAAEYVDDLGDLSRDDRQQRQAVRRLEDELASLEARLQDRRARRSADAGTIVALDREIAALQARREALEQELLARWQQDDDRAAELSSEAAVTSTVRQRLARQQDELRERRQRADRAVPEITTELAHLAGQLPPRVARLLERIAGRHADPVADLVQGSCAGCGLSLPPQAAVDADREAALVQCQGCGRYVVARSSRRTRG